MKIQSIQKVIKVGDSLATTIPAKDAKALGIKQGDNVMTSYEVKDGSKVDIADTYEKFADQYSESLKNLADR